MAPGRGPRAGAKTQAAPAAAEAPPATEAPLVCAAGLLASAEAVFDRRVSDHLPQSYSVALPPLSVGGNAGGTVLEVLVWNVMCRGRAGREGQKGSALEGKVLSNNGLELDEDARIRVGMEMANGGRSGSHGCGHHSCRGVCVCVCMRVRVLRTCV